MVRPRRVVCLPRPAPGAWVFAFAAGLASVPALASLPPVPVPAENPITEPKRVLGKILFWDEQLSTSYSMSCGTCHMPESGGADPRRATNPGLDLLANTSDDILGSPGVVRSNAQHEYEFDPFYGLGPRATNRLAGSVINAAYFAELFWDGRAKGKFIDPQTGEEIISSGGALESQAVTPPLSPIEMSHPGVTWDLLTERLERAQPLALAADLPPDIALALADRPHYAELFRRAFGDGAITASRVAMALATYQRTLIADQTPWDLWMAGTPSALTQNQINGWNDFNTNLCIQCHTTPHFTDGTFRNIGVDPPSFDIGRQAVTGLTSDRGKFKVPSLRNVGLRTGMMHDGQSAGTQGGVLFYQNPAGLPANSPRRENRDPLMNSISLNGTEIGQITDFLMNGLMDPRVANRQFPFDRPTLASQREDLSPQYLAIGTPGTNNIRPHLFTESPAMVGLTDFRIGVDAALGGAPATLVLSRSAPVGGVVSPQVIIASTTTAGTGPGFGVATGFWHIDPRQYTHGDVVYLQWRITDPAASGGVALSEPVRVPLFCGGYGCPPTPCNAADITGVGGPPLVADDQLTLDDILAFVDAFNDGGNCPAAAPCNLADITDTGDTGNGPDGQLTLDDILAFVNAYNDGC